MSLRDFLSFQDIVIQCHDNPDADALASGYALHRYLTRMGKSPRFVYRGKNRIQKSNLLIMLEKLQIPVSYEPDFAEEPELLITVDCQYGQRNVTKTPAETVAVIDHHQISTSLPPLSEVRSTLGSCSTLVWDLIRSEGLSIKDDVLLSTALYYGLYTDTNRLSEVSHPLDRDMLDDLAINRSLITEMSNSNISLKELQITGKAILSYEYFEDNRYLILESEPCDPNILGVISDFSLETADVDVCLAYYVSPLEIKFSVRSCTKEVHANELADFLARDLGGGGGHIYKAGGTIRPEKLDALKNSGPDADPTDQSSLEDLRKQAGEILHQRMKTYFDSYDIIYAARDTLSVEGIKTYEKQPQELGCLKLSDVFPVDTTVLIRTLEGDITVTIKEDTYLMIGLEGEVYPILEEKLKKSYRFLRDTYEREFEYTPSVKNTATDEVRTVLEYARTVVSTGTSLICARPLTKAVKVFTAWDDEKYYSGDVGDYIAFRKEDVHDIYVIRARLFPLLYAER
jgi:phosphoglycolate phosphatase